MFSAFLPPFLKSTSNFKHLAKPTSTFKQFGTLSTFIPSLFPKLQTSKDFVRPMSKKPHYRTSFDSHFIKSSQTFVKSASKNFYHIFSSLWGKLSQKVSLLVICETFGLFFKTLTADEKFFLSNSDNQSSPIPMQFSKK